MHEQQEYTRLQQSRLYTAEQVQLLIDENYSQAHNQGVTKAINCMERIYGKVPDIWTPKNRFRRVRNLWSNRFSVKMIITYLGSPTTLDINHNADSTLKYEFKHE